MRVDSREPAMSLETGSHSEDAQHPKNLFDASGLKVGIVVSQFNASITKRLLEGALTTLKSANVSHNDIEIIRVPGALEIPVALKALIQSQKCNVYICLGAVIRGETSHYEVVVRESSHGVMSLSQEYGIPMGFGILACENEEQALARAGGNVGNAGSQAAEAAIAMSKILKGLKGDSHHD